MGLHKQMYGCHKCNYDICSPCYSLENKLRKCNAPKLKRKSGRPYAHTPPATNAANQLKRISEENRFLEAEVLSLDAEVISLEADRNSMKEAMQKYERAMSDSEDTISKLMDTIRSLKVGLEASQRKVRKLEKEKHSLAHTVSVNDGIEAIDAVTTMYEGALSDSEAALNESERKRIELKQQVKSLKSGLSESKSNVKRLENENRCLAEECKESRLTVNALRSELARMKRNHALDLENWRQWTGDQVVDWLCTAEYGRFGKYAKMLRGHIRKEGVVGADLVHIQKATLRNWGVIPFSDRKAMEQLIHKLVKKRSQSVGLASRSSAPYGRLPLIQPLNQSSTMNAEGIDDTHYIPH